MLLRGDSPNTRTRPIVGRSWPVSRFKSVLLPEPLGPSSPYAPGGQRERHIVDADHGAVEFRDVGEFDHR